MNGKHLNEFNARTTTFGLIGLAAIAFLALPVGAASGPVDADCIGVATCGSVEAECFTQTVTAQGVSDDESTQWKFTAYNSAGGQSYSSSGVGRTFTDKAPFTTYSADVIQVSGTLTANGVVVAHAAIGCA